MCDARSIRTWKARTSMIKRMLSWMVWFETAAEAIGDRVLPCSKAWNDSEMASPDTPLSEA